MQTKPKPYMTCVKRSLPDEIELFLYCKNINVKLPWSFKMMEKTLFSTHTINDIIGPLNEIEKKSTPIQVYTSGKIPLPLTTRRVAIVGSRKASPEGISETKKIAKYFVQQNIIIVSGLAEGIDTAAHTTAINEKGQTIAVLGTPLNKFYPAKNRQLQEIIMQEHLAISQFIIGQPVQPKNFVIRNRTMALISDATIIVEASSTSGTKHQCWEALRLGRPVFIHTKIMQNPHIEWITDAKKYGATEFSDPEEILDYLPPEQRFIEAVLK
ncbi:DNA-processing protein DprA [Candidatus Bathycorpusculum sp.]|uniref:DNA-processing protein DprA n=1 Tax=Candidatus Bathycorpusculum sp. TaxID=2994959 RepID=UPI0028327BEB|nr:DNA-protecting protein DprA [Candidatus Termitimicrobium sp.]